MHASSPCFPRDRGGEDRAVGKLCPLEGPYRTSPEMVHPLSMLTTGATETVGFWIGRCKT